MNRFNLTFRGEIQADRDPVQAKQRFGKLFGIDDPERLEKFFSGDTIILRRNLERKVAAEYFSKLQKLGIKSELVKVAADEESAETGEQASTTPPRKSRKRPKIKAVSATSAASSPSSRQSSDKAASEAVPENLAGQRWAVSARKTADAAEAAQRKARQEEKRKTEEKERQRKAAEEARLKAEEEEQQRKAAEEARHKAEEEERQRKAAEVARHKAEEEERQRKAAEEARLKAEKEERQRRAAEEEARRKAEEEEQRRKAEEEARLKAEEEERQRRAAEEEARRKAEEEARRKVEEEERQRKAEEEARRKAEEEERQRKAAEESRRKAEEEERQRKAAEEARRRAEEEAEKQRRAAEQARRRAEEEEEKQRRAAEEARRRAAEQEHQRKVAEAARRKAEEEERQRKAVEEARFKAEEEERQRQAAEAARRRVEEEERQRKVAEEARLKAEEEERQLQAALEARRRAEDLEQQRRAVEAARRRAEEKEQQRKAAEEARNRAEDEAGRRRGDEAARLRAEKQAQLEIANRKQRLEAEKATRLKTELQRRQAADPGQQQTAEAEPGAQVKAMEEQAINRAAEKLAVQPSLKPVQAKIKTRLETPRHRDRKPGILEERRRRRRQPGEPNFFKLRPFRNTPAIQGRAQRSRRKARLGATLAGIGLLGLLAIAGAYLSLPAPDIQQGPEAIAIQPGSGTAVLAGQQLYLHDRSGTGLGELAISSLGADELHPPLAFNSGGELFAMGTLSPATQGQAAVLLRCQLQEPSCAPFSAQLADRAISAFAIHPLFNTVFATDHAAGQLLKLDENGELLASAGTGLPEKPILRLESGLLFMNSAEAPAISVFRPDDDGFGRQLDEILLLPPAAVAAEQSVVTDFLWSAEHWWVVLANPDTGSTGLYRFDSRWNFISAPPLPAGMAPEQLINWGQKTLVADSRQLAIARFNAGGVPEVALVSNLLQNSVAKQNKTAGLVQLAWSGALLVGLLTLVSGLVMALLNWQRWLVYKVGRERGADPVEDLLPSTRWISQIKKRSSRLRRTGISYAMLAVALLLFAMSKNITVIQLLALMIALTGPAAALLLFARSQTGSIGISGRQLLLADHTGMYHMGSGPGIKHRGDFLLIDDVTVFTGSALLPAFSPEEVSQLIVPLVNTGIRVDRKTVAIKLLESHHPLATGGIAIATCWVTALVLLALEAW